MIEQPAPFDLQSLSRSIENERKNRDLTWADLTSQVGVAASTIRRFRNAKDAEADGVLALIRWLGVPPENYVNSALIKGERLGLSGDGYVRVDMELVAGAQGKFTNGMTRTTIQRLVEVAQRSGRSIASLTRFSEV